VVEQRRARFRKCHGTAFAMTQQTQQPGGVFWTTNEAGCPLMVRVGVRTYRSASGCPAKNRASRDRDRVERRGGREVYGEHRDAGGACTVGTNQVQAQLHAAAPAEFGYNKGIIRHRNETMCRSKQKHSHPQHSNTFFRVCNAYRYYQLEYVLVGRLEPAR
jgi:hypothetical protein